MKLTHYEYQRLAIPAAAGESRAFRQTFIAVETDSSH